MVRIFRAFDLFLSFSVIIFIRGAIFTIIVILTILVLMFFVSSIFQFLNIVWIRSSLWNINGSTFTVWDHIALVMYTLGRGITLTTSLRNVIALVSITFTPLLTNLAFFVISVISVVSVVAILP